MRDEGPDSGETPWALVQRLKAEGESNDVIVERLRARGLPDDDIELLELRVRPVAREPAPQPVSPAAPAVAAGGNAARAVVVATLTGLAMDGLGFLVLFFEALMPVPFVVFAGALVVSHVAHESRGDRLVFAGILTLTGAPGLFLGLVPWLAHALFPHGVA